MTSKFQGCLLEGLTVFFCQTPGRLLPGSSSLFFCVFAYVFGFLALPPGGLMTACECPKPARSGLPSTAASKESNALILFKGAPPIAADPGRFPDFRIFGFFEKW